jgi:hypothetical protein
MQEVRQVESREWEARQDLAARMREWARTLPDASELKTSLVRCAGRLEPRQRPQVRQEHLRLLSLVTMVL